MSMVRYFMGTILYKTIPEDLSALKIGLLSHPLDILPKNSIPRETWADVLYEYIHHGRYILTFRRNLLYIVKRDFFDIIPSLGYSYGLVRHLKYEPPEEEN
jgi:hypothetical protein